MWVLMLQLATNHTFKFSLYIYSIKVTFNCKIMYFICENLTVIHRKNMSNPYNYLKFFFTACGAFVILNSICVTMIGLRD